MTAALWTAIAVLLTGLALCCQKLLSHRREAERLHGQIQSFLKGELASPAFSVQDSGFALFENAVIELETRLVQSHVRAGEEAAKGRAFVQDVSHQFKTPLAGLRLFCEMDESPHREQELQLISRMEALIAALLKLEKLRSDGYGLEYTLCDLGAVALEVKAQFAPLYPKKRIEVTGEASLRCDRRWMFEALGNIVKNACEHTSEGGRIQVFLGQSGSEAEIRVQDDGGGVPPQALPRLFERFYRHGADGDGRGVGLGLAIAKTIVQKHHGMIRAANHEGGLLLTIYLPILHRDLKETS
jgi:signal transduction histidine kinase